MPTGTIDDVIREVGQLSTSMANAVNAVKAYMDSQLALMQAQINLMKIVPSTVAPEQNADFLIGVNFAGMTVPVNHAANEIVARVGAEVTAPVAVGSTVKIVRTGDGEVKIAAENNTVQLLPATNLRYLRIKGSMAVLTKVGPDTWLVEGDLKADLGGEPAPLDPNDTSHYVSVFLDNSTRPISFRRGVPGQEINGHVWGAFAYANLQSAAARGNYNAFEWTDGYATEAPHEIGTRRDDQSYVFNAASEQVRITGYCPVVRDTTLGRTYLRAGQKSSFPNAADLTPHAVETRVDGNYLGALLNTHNSLTGPPPYEITFYGVRGNAHLPDPSVSTSFWEALWTRQANDHQSSVNPSARVLAPHTERDMWERTGLQNTHEQIFINHLYSPTGDGLVGQGGGFHTPSPGSRVADFDYDMRQHVTPQATTTYFRRSGTATWAQATSWTHPPGTPFINEPVYLQIDMKAGYRWADKPDWVKSVDETTPSYTFSFKTLEVRLPPENKDNWHIAVIDPATIPNLKTNWIVNTAAIDNAVPDGTPLANLTAAPAGYTYKVFPASGLAVVDNQIVKQGFLPPGGRDIAVWADRDDGAIFLVSTTPVLIEDNIPWWDEAADIDLLYGPKLARANGVDVPWSDYVNEDGSPTDLLKAHLPWFTENGVAFWHGTGAPNGNYGIYGNDATDMGPSRFVLGVVFDDDGMIIEVQGSNGASTYKAVPMDDPSGDWIIGLDWTETQSQFTANGSITPATTVGFQPVEAPEDVLFTGMWRSGYGDRPYAGQPVRFRKYSKADLGGVDDALIDGATLIAETVVE